MKYISSIWIGNNGQLYQHNLVKQNYDLTDKIGIEIVLFLYFESIYRHAKLCS